MRSRTPELFDHEAWRRLRRRHARRTFCAGWAALVLNFALGLFHVAHGSMWAAASVVGVGSSMYVIGGSAMTLRETRSRREE